MTEQPRLGAKAATRIAKNPATTADQLASFAGLSAAIDRLLAKHPNAGPDLLEDLSRSGDKTTRKYVALNPNSPKAVLVKLATQFPGDFFKNPAFDWLLLEDPNLMFEIGGGVLKNIVKRPECPVSFMNWTVAHGNEQQKLAVAMNAEAPVDALRKLVEAGGSLAEAARGHERIRDEQGNQYPLVVVETHIRAALGGLNSKQARNCWNRGLIGPAQWAALSPKARLEALSISSEFFVIEWLTGHKAILANDRNSDVRRAVAGDPTCSVKLMNQLGEDQDVDVRQAVARNPGCPAKVLEMLANDQVVDVREAVAENPACPLVVLEALAKDAEGYISWSVARNPSCPVAVLEALAKTGNSLVLSDIARHPSCPELLRASVLEVLLKDGNRYGRQDVAKNPSCPLTLLEVLAKDKEEDVRRDIAMNPACPGDLLEILAKDENRMVRRGVAENPFCPVALLEVLAADEDEYVHRLVAKHPSCPELLRASELELLSRDGDRYMRKDVAENPYCPVTLLEVLAKDEDKGVRREVAVNPACPVELLGTLAKDEDAEVRRGVAENPSCSVALLDVLAKDRSRDVRVASAKHPSCPSEALERLTQDKASAVRSQAVVHPRCPVAPEVLAMSAHSDVLRALGNNDQYPPSIRMTIQARLLGYAYQAVAEESGSASLADRLLSSDEGEVLTAFREELSSLLLQPQSSLLARLIGADHGVDIFQLRDDLADMAAKSSIPWARLIGLHHRSTSPEILAKQSKSIDWMERLAVACNPSSPQKILAQLKSDPHRSVAAAVQFGEQAKQLATVRQADVQARSAVLNIAPLVEEIRRRFSESTKLEKIEALVHGCWQSSIAERQLISAEEAAGHPNARTGLLEGLAKDQEVSVRSEVAGNPNTRAGLLEILAKDQKQVRWYLAHNPACPATVLVALAKDREEVVREEAIKNPRALLISAMLGAARMEKMVNSLVKRAKHENYLVRKAVAKNPFCPPVLLEVLVRDAEVVVGWAAVSNPSCPAALLEEFATNDSRYSDKWKCAVAENPACATATLAILANDSSASVRLTVAQNPAISIETLERLAKERGLQEYVVRNPACPPALLEVLAKESRLQEYVVGNPACPPALLEVLAKNPNRDVRHAAIRHPACPMVALNAFVESGDPWMVWLAIHNDNATPEQLLHWASDSGLHPALRLSCVLRPKFPASAKALADEVTALADAPPQPLSSVSDAEWILALQALKLYPDPEDKRAVTKAAKSRDWLQRAAATFCSSIQPNQLKLLLDDPEEIVRQLATQRLNRHETARDKVDRIKTGELPEAAFPILKTPCPKCGGVIQNGDEKFECKSCDYSNLKVLAGRQWESEEMDGLLSNRVIGPMSGFRNKRGQPFSAMVKLNAKHDPEFDSDFSVTAEADAVDFSAQDSLGACPKCGNQVFEHGNNYVCEKSVGPATSCDFHSRTIILQQEISQTEMQKLLESGKTSLLTGFVSHKTRRKFSAYLVCDATTGKISFEF